MHIFSVLTVTLTTDHFNRQKRGFFGSSATRELLFLLEKQKSHQCINSTMTVKVCHKLYLLFSIHSLNKTISLMYWLHIIPFNQSKC